MPVFHWFKKLQTPSKSISIISLDENAFLSSVLNSINQGAEASAAMCLVAYENLEPMTSAIFKLARTNPKEGLPTTLDEFIEYLAHTIERQSDELSKRRVQWFFLASLIKRANSIAANNPAIHNLLGEIWASLALGGTFLYKIYRDNALWSQDEKAWFQGIQNERDGVEHVINYMAPSIVRTNEHLQAIAKKYDIFVRCT